MCMALERTMTSPRRRQPIANDPSSDANRDDDDRGLAGPNEGTVDPDSEYSLEMLGRLYAQAVANQKLGHSAAPTSPADSEIRPSSPADNVPGIARSGRRPGPSSATGESAVESGRGPLVATGTSAERADPVPVTPASILEALLFVGSPDNAPLAPRKAASLIRGVSPTEIEALVDDLNHHYEQAQAAYRIVRSEQGYRLTLCADLQPVCARLRGRERPARLSPAAIEVLAVVAYHQPATVEEVDRLRNHQSGAILNQLVRRGLLGLQRDPQNARVRRYATTDRFLNLFGLDSIADLPRAEIDDGFDLP